MDILVFEVIQVLFGILFAVWHGKRLKSSDTTGAVLSSAFAAFAVGASLSFISTPLVARLCVAVFASPDGCLDTDDKTIWLMAMPLAAIPIFFVTMLLARRAAIARSGDD